MMNSAWAHRKSGDTSSDSSSLSGNVFGGDFFDGGSTFNPDCSLLNAHLAPRRVAQLRTNIFNDPDSFFYNSTTATGGSTSTDDDTFNLSSAASGGAFQFDDSFVGNFQASVRSTRLLPASAADSTGMIRSDLTLDEVVRSGQLLDFALDRHGVKFIETNYPGEPNDMLHKAIFEKLTEPRTVFAGLCFSSTGNFVVQKLVEHASLDEQLVLLEATKEIGLMEMCRDKFACRVLQLAILKFSPLPVTLLVQALSQLDLVSLSTDQCAIHVLQRIVRHLPVDSWSFFVEFLCRADNLMSVCQDKYGCRLVQQAIDRMSENPKLPCFQRRLQLLHTLMTAVTRNCFRLSSNEFANYVVQYVIKSSGIMEMYRDAIIDKCLLRNLLSMSQDKYASHVVEGAFLFAPPTLLAEMMDEIFDGYVKDHESNRDALDILLFHQFGNYVVQQMISICTSALIGKEERQLSASEIASYAKWYDRIKSRVTRHAQRLERFSSGKKIIESVMKVNVPTPKVPVTPTPPLASSVPFNPFLSPYASFLSDPTTATDFSSPSSFSKFASIF